MSIVRYAAIVGLTSILAACHTTPVADVRGHLPDLRFHLTNDDGNMIDESGFRGEPTMVYFGYSGCGNQCPLTLARLARIASVVRFRVAFVSVDPLDRPAVLHAFLGNFAPLDVHGLSGSRNAIADLARRYRAAAEVPGHATAIYLFDGHGRARMLISPDASDADLINAVREVGNA